MAAAAAGIAAILVAFSVGTMATGAAAPVRLSAKEFVFIPKDPTAPAGEVTFVVKNDGAIEHNFVLEDQAKKPVALIPVVEPGDTQEVAVMLTPGVYVMYCNLPGHREVGMQGSVTVK